MKELKKYYRQISGWLPCGGSVKREMMCAIRESVDGFVTNHPGIAFSAVQTNFGTPQQIAAAYVDELDTAELLNKLRVRRRILKVLLIGVAVALAIWSIALLLFWLNDAFGILHKGPPIID